MTRTLLSATALVLGASAASAAPVSLRFLGEAQIATGTQYQGTEFGGISGLDRLPSGDFVALSDDRGGSGANPRFYTLDIGVGETGFTNLAITDQTFLRRPDGTLFPADEPTVDPEGIRVAPNGNLYVSSEGNFSDDPDALFQPFVREFTREGVFVRALDLPEAYDYDDGETDGARDNQLLEALAVTPGGTVLVGNEGPLIPDGDRSTAEDGSLVRITAIDPDAGALAQYAYELPPTPLAGAAGSPGLTEILALSETGFLALERSFSGDVGNTVQITHAEIGPTTTDTLGVAALEGAEVETVGREVLVQITEGFEGVDNDNLEAMSFGPRLANGNRTLIVAADNNFNPPFQTTLFLAFEVVPVPLPAGLPLLAAGLGALALLRRRG